MAEKIKIKGAKQVSPKLRGLVALLISLCLVFFSFPFVALADNDVAVSSIEGQSISDNNVSVESKPVKNGGTLNFSPAIAGRVIKFIVNVNVVLAGSTGDTVGGRIDLYSSQIKNLKGSFVFSNSYVNYVTGYVNNGSLEFSTTLTMNCDNVVVPISIEVSFFDVVDSQHDVDLSVRVVANIQRESETSGLLKKVLNWLQSIFDNLKELPYKIGDFFSNLSTSLKQWFADVGNWFTTLGNNIKEWFTNLGDNLRQWFANVGDWFSSLGEKIGGFFTDIFNKIKEFFTNLFKPHDGYFDEVKTDLDNYLAAHLGIAYTAVPAIWKFTKNIFTDISNTKARAPVIKLPAIDIPIGNENIHLMDRVSINFSTYFNSDENMGNVLDILFGISDTILNVGAFICFCRVVYKKFVNKVGIEGGDEV